MPEFLPGDLVALLSGGPLLTVRAASGPWVTVDWFAGDEHCTASFHREQLAPVDFDDGEPGPETQTKH